MKTRKVVILIFSVLVLVLVGCDTESSPIQIEPEDSQLSLSDIDIESALVKPSDLVLEDFYDANGWVKCPAGRYDNIIDKDIILKEASVSYNDKTCEFWGSETMFMEKIFIFESGQQAARAAETIKEEIKGWRTAEGFSFSTESIDFGDSTFSVLRGSDIPSKWAYILLVDDEATIIWDISSTKLVDEDITDLSIIMLETLDRARNP